MLSVTWPNWVSPHSGVYVISTPRAAAILRTASNSIRLISIGPAGRRCIPSCSMRAASPENTCLARFSGVSERRASITSASVMASSNRGLCLGLSVGVFQVLDASLQVGDLSVQLPNFRVSLGNALIHEKVRAPRHNGINQRPLRRCAAHIEMLHIPVVEAEQIPNFLVV